MRIIIDAMGGDNAPASNVGGALKARDELGVNIALVGRKADIEACLGNADRSKIEIVEADEIITMEDDPSSATRKKKNSSMAVALRLLADGEGDAVISAGSTGALLTGATLTVKRVRGIRRAALAPVLPNGKSGVVLIDCGANVDCTAEYLLQFAFMGSFYSQHMLGIKKPKIGLLSNGTEDTKGGELQKQAFALLLQASDDDRINFIGNIEGSDVLSGKVDVVVTDGFTGNVFLKSTEGTIKFIMQNLRSIFTSSRRHKLAAIVLKKEFSKLKDSLDVNKVGGTALLGISKPVIKAHGSSTDEAISSAIKQTKMFAEANVIEEIQKNISFMRLPV